MRQFRSTQFLTAPVLLYLAWIMAFLFGIAGCLGESSAAVVVKPGEMQKKDQWIRDRLLSPIAQPALEGDNPVFSFVYGGHPSGKLLAEWPQTSQSSKLPKDRRQHTRTWTDAKTGLEVRCVAVEYADFPAVEWTVYFKNIGKESTPVIEKIQAIDTRIAASAGGEFLLKYNKGDTSAPDLYQPLEQVLAPNARRAVGSRRRAGDQRGISLL